MKRRSHRHRMHPQWVITTELDKPGFYLVEVIHEGAEFFIQNIKFKYSCGRCLDLETNMEQANGWQEPCPKCGIKRIGSTIIT